jgi:hypothetical protein
VLESRNDKDIFFHSLGLRFIAKSIAELSNAFFFQTLTKMKKLKNIKISNRASELKTQNSALIKDIPRGSFFS